MSTFIEARVIQKVDTEANWLSNPLKLYQGEIAFVSDKYNFKLNNTDIPKTFAELEYYYQGLSTPEWPIWGFLIVRQFQY